MKIPSLTKIPSHQKFKYEPRFYDPIKEEIAERTKRIKSQMNGDFDSGYGSTIRQSFKRRSRENQQSNITQVLIILLLVGTFTGYFYYGNVAFYIIMVLAPLYILIKKTNFFKKRS